MQSIINFKLFSKIVVLFLVLSLIVPSVSYALEGAAGGEADGSQYGGLVDGGTSGSDSSGSTDSTADSTASKEAAEAEKAQADADAANAAIAASGVDGTMTATPVDTSGSGEPPSGVNISVNGSTPANMSVESTSEAAKALGDATSGGSIDAASVGVSAEKTVTGYADGSLSNGQVVGTNTGYKGTPGEVLAQETNYNSSVNSTAIAAARGVSSLNDSSSLSNYQMAPSIPTQTTIPNARMFDPTALEYQKPSLGGLTIPAGFSAPISVKTESIKTTPSSDPSYNSFNNDIPTGITSAQYNAQTNSITASFVDGSTRDLTDKEIAAINSNTPKPTNTSWTSTVSTAVSNTYTSVVSGITSLARTVGSYVGIDIPETPKITYTDLASVTNRINASIDEKTLTDIGVAVTPTVVNTLQNNQVNVTLGTPSINYGFVDKKSLTQPSYTAFDSQYIQNIESAKRDLATIGQGQQDYLNNSNRDYELATIKDEGMGLPEGYTPSATAVASNPPDSFVNTGNNPGNINAPGYTTSIPGTPNNRDEFVNTGNNPGNVNAPGYTTSIPGLVNTTNIGTVPEPGPYGTFSGTNIGVDINNITTVKVVNFSGSSNPAENAKAATPAQVAALGGMIFSSTDISALGKAIAGEVSASIVGKIQNGQTLTPAELAEIGLVKDTIIARAFAEKRVLFGPFDGSIEAVITAGSNNKNTGQFSAFNDDTLGKTLTAYNKNPAAFDAVAKSFVDGTVAKTYGLNVAAPTPKANAYYNPDVASPPWAKSLTEVTTLGSVPHSHITGTLPGEYRNVGQVEGVDNLNTSALSAMNKVAAGGFVSGTGQYNTVSPNTSVVPIGSQPTNINPATANRNVSLPDTVQTVPSSRADALSLPDTVNTVPTSRASALGISGGFVNTGNNPGNINAPGYTTSIPGTPNINNEFVNTGNNPGNINAPIYSNSIAGTPSLNGGFVNTGNNPGNRNAPNYSTSIAGTPSNDVSDQSPENTYYSPGLGANLNNPSFDAINTPSIQTPTLDKPISEYFDPNTTYIDVNGYSMNMDPLTGIGTVKDTQGNVLGTAEFDLVMTALDRKDTFVTLLPDSVSIPPSRPTESFVNTGNNPGNINAPTYSNSQPGDTRPAVDTAKLTAAYTEYTNSRIAAEKMVAENKLASAYSEYANSRNTAEEIVAQDRLTAAYTEYTNSRIAAEKMVANQKVADAYAEYAESRTTSDRQVAEAKLSSAYAEYANTRVASNQVINNDVGVSITGYPTPIDERFAPTVPTTPSNPDNFYYSPTLGMNIADNTIANPPTESTLSYADIAAATDAAIREQMAEARVADAYAEYAESRTTSDRQVAEAKLNAAYTEYANTRVASNQTVANQKVADAYAEYAESRTTSDRQVAEAKLNAAYTEYANTRTTADRLAEQDRIASIKDDSFAPPVTSPSFVDSVWNGVKGVTLDVVTGTAELARSTVDGIKGLFGIEPPVDTRVVSTQPQDDVYRPFGDNTIPGKIGEQLATDETGVTVALNDNQPVETTAAIDTAPIDERFAPSMPTTPTTPATQDNSYYSPTLGMNITDNSFNAAPNTNINTPSLGAPISAGFDPNTTYVTDTGKTLSINPQTGEATAYDSQGNEIMTGEFDEAMTAIGNKNASIQTPSNNSYINNNPPEINPNNAPVINTPSTPENYPPDIIDTKITENKTDTTIIGTIGKVVNVVTDTVKTVYTGTVSTISGWFGGNDAGNFDYLTDGSDKGNITGREIKSVTLHLNIPMICPNVESTTTGYIYEVEYYEHTNNGQNTLRDIAQPRCGSGGPRTYATEISADLTETYNFSPIASDQILEIMEINFNPPNDFLSTN